MSQLGLILPLFGEEDQQGWSITHQLSKLLDLFYDLRNTVVVSGNFPPMVVNLSTDTRRIFNRQLLKLDFFMLAILGVEHQRNPTVKRVRHCREIPSFEHFLFRVIDFHMQS